MLSDEARSKLLGVTAATLTTCLFKRGFHNQYLQNVHPVSPKMPRMVGSAFTLRFIPAREDLDTMDAYKDPEHPQRKAIETISTGEVLVIDSRGDPRGASAGDILLRRIMMRGAAGAVTDGGFRDTPAIAEMNFPVYQQHSSAPTGPIYHHAVDFIQPIACGGAAVYPGDILVGDGEGVVVLPAHMAEELAHESAEMTLYEDWVEIQVMAGSKLPGIYPQTAESKAAFEEWRAKKG